MVLSGDWRLAGDVQARHERRLPVLARTSRPRGSLSGWRAALQTVGAAAGSRQVVLVGDRLRLRHALANSRATEEGGAAIDIRAERRRGHIGGSVLWTDAGRSDQPVDPDATRKRLVRLFPHLWARRPGLRRQLEAW